VNKLRNSGTTALAASALVVVAQTGFSAEVSYHNTPLGEFTLDAGAGLLHHSNAAFSDEDKRSDMERIIHANIGYQHPDDGRFLANLNYQVQRRDFQHDVQTDQTAVDGIARIRGHLIQDRLDVILENLVSESLTDTRQVDVTGNQERRSVTTIGLDGFAHLSAADALVLSPRYTDVSMQRSTGSDSQRSLLTAGWQHKISQVTQAQLSATYGTVRFDDSTNNYKLTSAQLGFKTALARLSYQLTAGFNRFDRDHGKNVDGYTAQIGVDYRGDGYTWGGSVVHELTDTSIGLSQAQFTVSNFEARDNNFDAQDLLKRTQAEIHGQRHIGPGQLDASAGYHKDDYNTLPRDEQGYFFQVSYLYPLNSYWSLGATVRYERVHFLNEPNNFTYRETTPEVYALLRWSERLSARFGVGRSQRRSDEALNTYTDNQVMVDLNYRFF